MVCLPRLEVPLFAQLELEAVAAVKKMEAMRMHLEAELGLVNMRPGLEIVDSKRASHYYSSASAFQLTASAGSVEFGAAVALL